MKPPEILGMLEEAAGTRMFETKKQSALKTIEKKEIKVEEINAILAEQITPQLEKLRADKSHYLKYTANNAECERTERFCIAYKFIDAQKTLEKSAVELEKIQEQRSSLEEKIQEDERAIEDCQEQSEKVAAHKKMAMEGDFKVLEEDEKERSKVLVKFNSEWENKQQTVAGEVESKQALEAQVAEITKSITKQGTKLKKLQSGYDALEKDVVTKADELEANQQKLQDCAAGMVEAADGEAQMNIAEALTEAKRQATVSESEEKKMKMRITHLKGGKGDLDKRIKAAKKDVGSLESDFTKATDAAQKIEAKVNKIGFNSEMNTKLVEQQQQLEQQNGALQQTVDKLNAQLGARLNFQYNCPSSFDRSKVKGMVAKLIQLNDPSTSTALEAAAGGKLYQVVVDTVATGQTLLEKGKLRARVTIIPLDKISGREIDPAKLKAAKKIAGADGNVETALSLVGCEAEVKAAMAYVFGSTLVCDSLDLAKKVTFHRDVKVKTVTLEGDSFDPSGSLSGGAKQRDEPVLSKLHKLAEAQTQLTNNQEQLTDVRKELSQLAAKAQQHAQLAQQLELSQHKAEMAKERLGQSRLGQLTQEQEDAAKQLEDAETQLVEAVAMQKESKKRYKDLEKEMKEQAEKRKKMTKELEKEISKSRTAYANAKEKLKEAKTDHEVLEMEVAQAQVELKSVNEQVEKASEQIAKLQDEEEVLAAKVDAKREEYQQAREALAEKQEELSACDEELKELMKKEGALSRKISANQLELKKIDQKISRFDKDKASAESYVEAMIEQQPWIEAEKQFFGRQHTDYDFESRDISKAQKRLRELKDEQAALSKKINKKVMGMIEKAEQEYQELIHKRQIIENDRAKIEKVIEELDEKKNEAMQKTWEKVNKSFGSIFSELLPGTSAKLEPPEGGTVLDGLRVMVAFGAVWKQSLTELSGGQRSLLALSLILSLLLFKPAPMYILDEVDAALDLSHTQNIGQMLRNHFSHSQFIVVSLKEGMFNNANVVFRTKFIDGVSTVTRTAGLGKQLKAAEQEANENAGAAANKRAKGAKGRAGRKNNSAGMTA
jgi:structural maintenance of chromosome 2